MRKAIIAAILLLAACGGSNKQQPDAGETPAPPPNTPQEAPGVDPERAAQARKLVEQGIEAFNKASFDDAIPLFEQATEADSGNAEAFAWLADTYNRKERLSEAKLAYRTAAKLSTDAKARTRLAYLAADMALKVARKGIKDGQHKMAVEQARDALADNPTLVAARGVMAEGHFLLKQFEEAREQYNLVSEESSGAVRHDALYWVGQCWLRLHKTDEAEKVFTGLINEGYKANNVYFWRGMCRRDRKDYSGARTDMLQAIDHAESKDMQKELQAELKAVEDLIAAAEKGK